MQRYGQPANGHSAYHATDSEGRPEPSGIAATAAFLAEQLAGFADLGVADVSIVPGQDDDTSLHTVGVLVDEVLPALRAAGVPLD